MPRKLQANAAQLLTPQELFELNGGALGFLPENVRQRAFERLSEPVRRVLETENQLRYLLSRPETSFGELERVAVLMGDPPAGEHGPSVPRGRWSYHPDGYFVRFFPSGYSRTRIEVNLPEPLTVERDRQGRITSIADRLGNLIETTYDPSIEPLVLGGDSAVRAFAFSSIRFVHVNVGKRFAMTEKKWESTGWTLVGVPVNQGLASLSSGSGRFTGLRVRYEEAIKRKREFDELVRGGQTLLHTGTGDSRSIPPASIEAPMDLSNLHSALTAAVGQDRVEESWVADHLALIIKAWSDALRNNFSRPQRALLASASMHQPNVRLEQPIVFGGLGSAYSLQAEVFQRVSDAPPVRIRLMQVAQLDSEPSGLIIFDPAAIAAMPADTGRQRLGLSGCSSLGGDLAGSFFDPSYGMAAYLAGNLLSLSPMAKLVVTLIGILAPTVTTLNPPDSPAPQAPPSGAPTRVETNPRAPRPTRPESPKAPVLEPSLESAQPDATRVEINPRVPHPTRPESPKPPVLEPSRETAQPDATRVEVNPRVPQPARPKSAKPPVLEPSRETAQPDATCTGKTAPPTSQPAKPSPCLGGGCSGGGGAGRDLDAAVKNLDSSLRH